LFLRNSPCRLPKESLSMASGLLEDLRDAEERLQAAAQDVARLRELVASWRGVAGEGGEGEECHEGRFRDAASVAAATQAAW